MRHQEDLKLLRQRLNLLDDNQQQQLGEFADIATSTVKSVVERYDESVEKIDIEKATSPTHSMGD